jgi:hypothetical protein
MLSEMRSGADFSLLSCSIMVSIFHSGSPDVFVGVETLSARSASRACLACKMAVLNGTRPAQRSALQPERTDRSRFLEQPVPIPPELMN